MLFPRVLIAMSVLDMTVAWKLLPYITVPFAVGVTALLLGLPKNPDVGHPMDTPSNPLQLRPALQMAGTFQLVLFAVNWVHPAYGDVGLLVPAALLGFSDVDALTSSMAKSGASGVAATVAAEAIAIGILANSVLKLSLALALGTPEFRRMGGVALAAMALAMGISIGLLRT
jgi:uncharacterized membrane protein (DUF4010 family)